jgi:hypothetical protein
VATAGLEIAFVRTLKALGLYADCAVQDCGHVVIVSSPEDTHYNEFTFCDYLERVVRLECPECRYSPV